MASKTIVTGIASIVLAVTPTIASAQTTVPASAVQPATEEVEGTELRNRGFVIPLVVLVAIVLSIVLLTAANDEDDDLRRSP